MCEKAAGIEFGVCSYMGFVDCGCRMGFVVGRYQKIYCYDVVVVCIVVVAVTEECG